MRLNVTGIPDVCHHWHRVACDDTKKRITALHLANVTELSGSVPMEVSGLVHLQRLELYNNIGLGGTLPSELGQLNDLQYLYLHETSLTATVPSQWGRLGQLRELFLSHSNLTGDMPDTVCQLRKAGALDALHADCGAPFPPKLNCPYPECCTNCYH